MKPLHIDNNKIFINNYEGKGFGDNAKAIAVKLHEIYPKVNICWLVNNKDMSMPLWITQIVKSEESVFSIVKQMSTSRVWIYNLRAQLEDVKKKNQFYIMTWHGGTPLKMIESDAGNMTGKAYVRRAKYDSKIANLMISGNGFMTNLMKNSFWYNGPIIETGTPRLDVLFEKKRNLCNVYRFFNIDENSHLLLYAPTFRLSGKDVFNLDYYSLIRTLKQKTKIDYKIIVKFHPNTDKKSIKINYDENILDGTDYPDLYELLPACDILISDYSGTMFDMAILKKPVWLYMPDLEEYLNKERHLYFDLKSLPFPKFTNNKEIPSFIDSFDKNQYDTDVAKFMKTFNFKEDGKASDRVAKVIHNILIKTNLFQGIEKDRIARK